MNHRSTSRAGILCRTAAAVVCGVVVAVLAGARTPAPSTPGPIDSFVFDGGTIREYVDQIRAVRPGSNIVVDERIADVPVPPMRLAGVDVESLMWVLEARTVDWNNRSYACEVTTHPAAAGPLYRLGGRIDGPSRGRAARPVAGPALITSVHSVAELVADGMSADSIVGAMEIAVEVHGLPRDEMEIVFHAPTRLLIMRGPTGAIEICWEVLAESGETAMLGAAAIEAESGEDS